MFCAHRPAALHSLGCSAEEIAAALERRREKEKEAATLKAAQDKTQLAELDRREKDAKNPPEGQSSGGGGGASSSSGGKAPAAAEPSKPESEAGGD